MQKMKWNKYTHSPTNTATEFPSKHYGKCSKILKTFLFLFSKKMLAHRGGIYKMLVRIANSEDPDQTASSGAVWSRSALFALAFLAGN